MKLMLSMNFNFVELDLIYMGMLIGKTSDLYPLREEYQRHTQYILYKNIKTGLLGAYAIPSLVRVLMHSIVVAQVTE
jgi:hypothetical protein